MKSLSDLSDILSKPQQIVITHHFNPDADAFGSSLGLCHYLTRKGHQCQVISPNSVPDFLLWMPGAEQVLVYDQQKAASDKCLASAAIVFSLDYNHISRTQTMSPALESFQGIRVLIDHHLFPDENFDYGLSLTSKSSTCEMVYDYIVSCGDASLIDASIGSCLYAGVMTDTGSFKFPSTTASVHTMVADLIHKGVDTPQIHSAVFDTYEENRLRFLGYVLSEKMKLYPEQHASIIDVSKEDLSNFLLKTGDTEGIVNYPLSIRNIIFSTFISERDNEIRMSFRSKGSFNVNEFARTFFNGGGHVNAAGGRSNHSLSDTLEILKNAIQQQENKLQQCYNELF